LPTRAHNSISLLYGMLVAWHGVMKAGGVMAASKYDGSARHNAPLPA